ncbi:flavodoxin domain-containing protein [Pseudodonghicola flavimaris]|uniref:Flavodoxin domain-containing protein n=1 Tax=Pseudodonghicola flavimaris TaxID=3050036 RepID=A0ABT7EUX4_9RHOB|nr:flavodoxin domain-containing protein [Pseudodonghicola flavimaris]MDK3016146.1 flavodoxin domain-containing protein [Pseudodonghicola flavimaris]
MRVLICYASTEGQTRKICRFCAEQLIAHGHSVEMLPVAEAGEIALAPFDAAILAGSVHLGRLQAPLSAFAADHALALNRLPTLFLVVSLAIASGEAEDRAELDRIAAEFCAGGGWRPGRILHVAGAFRFSEYDVFRSLAMRWIARRRGQQVDPHQDREYTDWPALAEALAEWAGPGA